MRLSRARTRECAFLAKFGWECYLGDREVSTEGIYLRFLKISVSSVILAVGHFRVLIILFPIFLCGGLECILLYERVHYNTYVVSSIINYLYCHILFPLIIRRQCYAALVFVERACTKTRFTCASWFMRWVLEEPVSISLSVAHFCCWQIAATTDMTKLASKLASYSKNVDHDDMIDACSTVSIQYCTDNNFSPCIKTPSPATNIQTDSTDTHIGSPSVVHTLECSRLIESSVELQVPNAVLAVSNCFHPLQHQRPRYCFQQPPAMLQLRAHKITTTVII